MEGSDIARPVRVLAVFEFGKPFGIQEIMVKLKQTPPPEKEGFYYCTIRAPDGTAKGVRLLEIKEVRERVQWNNELCFFYHRQWHIVQNNKVEIKWYGEVPMLEIEE